jgi:hypothetical protein
MYGFKKQFLLACGLLLTLAGCGSGSESDAGAVGANTSDCIIGTSTFGGCKL